MFKGMDIEAVRALASKLTSAAEELTGFITQISGKLGETEWVGDDRTKFEGDWDGHYKGVLERISSALEEFSGIAERNATEQETASSQ